MFQPQVLNADQLKTVITYCRRKLDCGRPAQERDAAGILFGTLGLRIGEVVRLRCSDLRDDPPRVHVRTLKGGRPRDVPIDTPLHNACRRLAALAADPTLHLLRTRTGGKVSSRNLRRRWATWCKDALGRSVRFHDLRHSLAHFVFAQDRDIFAVQRLLGHRKIETTHLYLRTLNDLAAMMPGADT